jgi:COMPASS component SWD1
LNPPAADQQEDEAEIARRKMKEEEEEVDVITITENVSERQPQAGGWNGDHDEDILWADEEPDDDVQEWSMKTVMEVDSEVA